MKALLFANTDWFLHRFERELAHALRAAGAEVVLVAPQGPYTAGLEAEGFRCLPLTIERRRVDPLRELATARSLGRLLRSERPDLLHSFTLKSVLHGAIAGRRAGVPVVVGSITGLGHLYSVTGWRIRTLRWLFERVAGPVLRKTRTIFLNRDDHRQFVDRGLVDPESARCIASSGVDVERFRPAPQDRHPTDDDRPLVVLPARMLRSKGIATFVAAARRAREQGLGARWVLAGGGDPGNPEAFSDTELDQLVRDSGVEHWGFVEDMIGLYRHAAVVCLPTTYREGVPTVLLEAAACGCPTVATDVPGCRDAIENGVTGLLVPPRDPEALAEAVGSLLGDPTDRRRMGIEARRRMVRRFSVEQVVRETFEVYRRAGLEIPEPDFPSNSAAK